MKEEIDLITLEDYFDNIKLFILELQFCIENIEELSKAQIEGINLKPIENFLSHYVYISYSHIAINFYKIYKPNEKRSFQKLFNKLKTFKYSNDLKKLLLENADIDDENRLKSKSQLLNSINSIENKISENEMILNKIFLRRETFYAHTDPGKNSQSEKLSELIILRDLTIQIYNELYGQLFGRYYMFNAQSTLINEILDDRKFVDEYWRNQEDNLN